MSQTFSSPNYHWSTADTDTWLLTRKITILRMQCSKSDEQMHFLPQYTYLYILVFPRASADYIPASKNVHCLFSFNSYFMLPEKVQSKQIEIH